MVWGVHLCGMQKRGGFLFLGFVLTHSAYKKCLLHTKDDAPGTHHPLEEQASNTAPDFPAPSCNLTILIQLNYKQDHWNNSVTKTFLVLIVACCLFAVGGFVCLLFLHSSFCKQWTRLLGLETGQTPLCLFCTSIQVGALNKGSNSRRAGAPHKFLQTSYFQGPAAKSASASASSNKASQMTCTQIFLGSEGKAKQKEERRRLNSLELQPAICDFKGSKPTASRYV